MRFIITEFEKCQIRPNIPHYITNEIFRDAIKELNTRVLNYLGGATNKVPLVFDGTYLTANGIAGVVSLMEGIEIEIIPKFLTNISARSDWKNTLFYLSLLSRYGYILSSSEISSTISSKHASYELSALLMVNEYSQHHRQFVREYTRSKIRDFSIQGEIDYDNIYDIQPEGILQDSLTLSKSNQINATIQSAMKMVLSQISTPSSISQLEKYIYELGNQPSFNPTIRLSVPARNFQWSKLYNLAFDIISGCTVSLEEGSLNTFGYVADTWRIWEWFISYCIKNGLSHSLYSVKLQNIIPWGTKFDCDNKISIVQVKPDISIFDKADGKILYLADAKYKVISKGAISNSDIYEAVAFCQANNTKVIALIYPDNEAIHKVKYDGKYEIGDITIIAIKVSIGIIDNDQDLRNISNIVSTGLIDTIESI